MLIKPISTFEDYFRHILMSYILDHLTSVRRIDVVWHNYIQDSLKSVTLCKKGKGIRRRVQPDTVVPGNWESFLRVNDNKKELFA